MANYFLKGTSSLCMALMLGQPVGSAFAAQVTPPHAAALSERTIQTETLLLAQAEDGEANKREERRKKRAERKKAEQAEARKDKNSDSKSDRAKNERRDERQKAQKREERQQANQREERQETKQQEERRDERQKAQKREERQQANQREERQETKQQEERRDERQKAQKREERQQTKQREERQETKQQEERRDERQKAQKREERQQTKQREERQDAKQQEERRDERREAEQRLREGDRDGRRRPAAAEARREDLSRRPGAREIRVRDGDVRRSDQDARRWREGRRDRDRWDDRDRDRWRDDDDRWRDRDRWDDDDDDGGLKDWQVFGLGALSAVAVGAVIYGAQEVISNDGDRVVTRGPQGNYNVYRDDDALIRRPGSTVYVDPYNDGSVQSEVVLEDGTRIYTVRDVDGRVLSRRVQRPNVQPVVLFDDTARDYAPIPARLPPRSPVAIEYDEQTSLDLLYGAFETDPSDDASGRYALSQVRDTAALRYLTPEVSLASLNFPSGSSAIPVDDAGSLAPLGDVMRDIIERNPAEVFLIEGHSDATGDAAGNLLLSDERAESVALALTELFGVPPENLIIQGYGESDLKVQTQGANEVNRRVIVRRITPLLAHSPAG